MFIFNYNFLVGLGKPQRQKQEEWHRHLSLGTPTKFPGMFVSAIYLIK